MEERAVDVSRCFPTTDLSDDTILVVPNDMATAPPVLRLQRLIAERGGRPPEIVPQGHFRDTYFRDAQVIACGTMADNAALRRLYTARCCFLDTFFPGGDGYFVKSISDPFGHGKNAIALGAGTPAGLSAALSAFEDAVRANDGALGRIHAARFRHSHTVETVERIFSGQADCYKPNDDAGVGYAWLVPKETLSYLLYRDDYRYLENAHVADLCKLAVVTTDNMRSEGNYGDTGGYPAFSQSGWEGRLWPLMASTWHTRDPRHLWALNWLGEGKTPPLSSVPSGLYAGVEWTEGGFSLKGCEPEEPRDLLGICPMELPEPVLRWVRRHAPESHHPDPRKTYFDKLSLRRNFHPRGEYLLLEGLGATCHGHEDTNAIVRLTWNDRAWLADGDYIRAAPKFHNAIVIERDGMGVLHPPGDGVVIPPLASLNRTDDGPAFGLVQTEAPRYNGVDWQRNLFWRKGRYIAAIDRLLCTQAGEYRCRCLWRLVGETDLRGPDVRLHQQGESFYIRNADGASQEIVPDHHEKSRWKSYPYADGILHVLHQVSGRALLPGESLTFLNLLTPYEDIRIERLADRMVRISDGAETTVLGAGDARLGGLEIQAEMFALSLEGEALTLQGVERLSFEEGEKQRREDFGSARLTLDIGRCATAKRIRDAVASAAPEPPPHSVSSPPRAEGGLRRTWSREIGASEIRDIAVSGEALLAGTEDGRVIRLAADDGTAGWTTHLSDCGPANALLLADIDADGTPEALVGTDDSHLLVLDGRTGTERWRRKLKNLFGREGKVSAIATADLEGSGRTSILAGTEGWYVNTFAPDGTPEWATWVRYHAITALIASDADGDGRAEVLVGTEYSTPLTVHNHDGSFRWSTFEEVGSEGNATTPRRGIHLTHMQLCDVDGDGIGEIVYGTADGWLYVVRPQDGAEIWHANLAGEIAGIIAPPDRLIAATEYGGLTCFDHRGERLWHVRAAGWIRDIARMGKHIAVAAENGAIRIYDLHGACVKSAAAGGEMRSLRRCGAGVVCSVAGGRLCRIES